MTASGATGGLGQRGGVRRLSQGLITYGIVGLVVATIGFGATVWVSGRISTLRADAQVSVARAANTMELAAIVLRGASTTVQSFSGTADQASQAVSAAVVTVIEVRSELSALEAQLRSVSFLGTTPLGSSADAVGRITASLDGLETAIPVVADRLKDNRAALVRNADALNDLADSTAALATGLGPTVGQDAFGDVQQVIVLTLLMFTAWSLVPAAGALGLGAWLRGEHTRAP